MTGKTHTFTALVTGIMVVDKIESPLGKVLFLSGCLISAKLPDIDTKLKMRHRGHTHSIVGFLLFAIIAIPMGFNGLTMGLLWGYLMHILADSFTVSGTYPLYPNRKLKLKIGNFKTGNRYHETGFKLMVLSVVVLYYNEIIKGFIK